jgi:hypothetical protein
MKTVVIGGHSRKVGKTLVTAGLIHALAEYSWTALKISSHEHQDFPSADVCAIYEEKNKGAESDSSRYLAAGAARSCWIRVREERSDDAMARIQPILLSSSFVIIESNWILRYLQPDIYIIVLKYDVDDFKKSARETLGRAHAAVAVRPDSSPPAWREFVHEGISGIPVFSTSDPLIVPVGLVDFVRSKIQG